MGGKRTHGKHAAEVLLSYTQTSRLGYRPEAIVRVTNFEFVFSLFSVMLGFSLAEVLGGFARALRHRRAAPVGWLTPLLGLFVILDLLSFWETAWGARTHVQPQYGFLVVIAASAATYYLAASLVFPAHVTDLHDYDEHFFEHRRQILAAVAFWHVVGSIWLFYLVGSLPMVVMATLASYYVLLAVAFVSKMKALTTGSLMLLCGIYLVTAVSSLC
jgi:hypothetical protein